MGKISLKNFIDKHLGEAVANPEEGSYKGECVSLVQMYLYECFGIGFKARGNADDYCYTLINEGLAEKVTSPKYGDIMGWLGDSNIGEKGHVAIYLGKDLCLDQSNGQRKTAQKRKPLAGVDIYVRMKQSLVPDAAVKPEKLKFKVGDKVIINGELYESSNDTTVDGYVKNKTTHITLLAKGSLHPYNTTGNLGWMDEEDIKLAKNTLEVGDNVEITGKGNTQADGKGRPNGGVGFERKILKIHTGKPYPYQVGNDKGETTGFYKESELKEI